MTRPSRRGGGLRAFRLADIPEPIRQRAKSAAMKNESNEFERFRIGYVAEFPSPTVYWIPRQAWEKVMLPKNRRTP